jgi:hypothetical protein
MFSSPSISTSLLSFLFLDFPSFIVLDYLNFVFSAFTISFTSFYAFFSSIFEFKAFISGNYILKE